MPYRSFHNSYERSAPKMRLVIFLSEEDVKSVDEWGVSNGATSRSDAIRSLVKRGLKDDVSRENKPAPESK